MCLHGQSIPDKAAKDVKAAVLSAVQIHAEDGRKDEKHHSKVKYHDNCGLKRETMSNLSTYSNITQDQITTLIHT